jgi:exopolysaccharide production protein ExoZ
MSILGIQYLRALSALAVVVYHAAHGAAFAHAGHRGVDVFFVISGFIVTYTTHGRVQAPLQYREAQAFLKRRVLRIVPLYWLATLVSALLRLRYGTLPSSLLLDVVFIAHPHALYPKHCWPFLVPGWSLNYEVFFYAVFALSMLTGRRHALVAALVMGALSDVGSSIPTSGVTRFYLGPFGAEFCLGIGLALLHLRTRIRLPVPAALMLFGLCMALLFRPHANQQSLDALLAAGLVYASLYAFQELRMPQLGLLGDASYAIYLAHTEAVGGFHGYVLKPLGMGDANTLPGLFGMLLSVLLAAGVGVAAHLWVERPLQARVRRWFS